MAFYLNGYPRVIQAGDTAVVVYIDESWPQSEFNQAEAYIQSVCAKHTAFLSDSQYAICFVWKNGSQRMLDMWRFSSNEVDDLSGPTADVRIFAEGNVETDDGVGSGNTLVVLGLEEQHRRESQDLQSYLASRPQIVPWLSKD